MHEDQIRKLLDLLRYIIGILIVLLILLFGSTFYLYFNPDRLVPVRVGNNSDKQLQEKAEKTTLLNSELVEGAGLSAVLTNCTGCHSAKLIAQNRATREGWLSMIRWMQGTQGLWDLGENEEIILDYLATNYSPQKKGRRQNLGKIEWYVLER